MVDIYNIWFSNLEISNKVKLKLLKEYSDCRKIWELSLKREKIIEDEKIINKILDFNLKKNLDKYVNYMLKNHINIINIQEEVYPSLLKQIDNPPVFLYIRGNIENLYDDNIAIVGSREVSKYGILVSRKISREIADKNVNIVSGLARRC